MLPEIEFRYSFIYQEEIHLPKTKDYNRTKWEKEANKFIQKLKKEWQKHTKILGYMSSLTGLKWKENKIKCYVVMLSESGPISDPLTIPIKSKHKNKIFPLDINGFIDILTHELIHQLFLQNEKQINKYFDNIINKKYKKQPWNTRIHIPIHAIHKKIFDKFFGKKRLQKEIKNCSNYPEYKKAWDIVIKEGEDNIIKEMKETIKTNH